MSLAGLGLRGRLLADFHALRWPSDASVRTLHSAEGHDVETLIPEPETMIWTFGCERARREESLAHAEKCPLAQQPSSKCSVSIEELAWTDAS